MSKNPKKNIPAAGRDITQQNQAAAALRESEERYRGLFENMVEGFAYCRMIFENGEPKDWIYLSANRAFENLTGLKDVAGKRVSEVIPGIAETDQELLKIYGRVSQTGKAEQFEMFVQALQQWFAISVYSPKKEFFVVVFDVITGRKQVENELQRVNRALRLTSLCHQEMVRATDEAALLQAVCHLAVESGGYRMAWVGFAELDAAKSVRPAAHAGFDEGYLDAANITWADDERGRGPTGTAIRTGKPVHTRNLSTDPAFGPWRAAAIQRGYASSIALPLMNEGRCLGALTMYAGEPDAFDAGEIELLAELAGDLAYGIGALRHRAERKQAEEALRASETEFRTLAEAMPQIVWMTRPDGWNIYFNQQWVDYTGLTMEESHGHGWNKPFHPDDRQRAWDAWQRATTKLAEYSLECRLRRADGEYRWWLVRGVPLRDAAGNVLKWFGTCTDIHESKLAEEKAAQEQARFKLIFDSTPIGIAYFTKQPNGQHSRIINDAHLKICGLTREQDQVPGIYLRITHPEDAERQQKLVNELGSDRVGKYAMEKRYIRPDGQVVWVAFTFHGRKRPDGSFEELTTVVDITERKKMEMALHESRALYHSLVEQMPAGVFRKDREGRYIFVNSVFCRLKSLSADEILGKTPKEVDEYVQAKEASGLPKHPPRQRTLVTQGADHHELIMRTGKPIELEEAYPQPDGTVEYFYAVKTPIFDAAGRVVGSQGMQFDITQRKRAEDALKESESRFQTLADSSPVGIFRTDTQGQTIYVNPRWCEISGLSMKEALGDGWLRAVHPDDRERLAQVWRAAAQTRSNSSADYRFVHPDGTINWVMGQAIPLKDSAGHMVGYVGTITDITERKQAEAALNHERDLWQTMLDNSPDHIYFKDTQSRFIKSSQAQARQFGLKSPDEMVGKTDFDFFDEAHARPAFEDEQEIIRTGRPMIAKEEREVWNDGHVTWASSTKMRMHDAAGKIVGIMGISRDITERKRTETALRESQALYRSLVEQMPAGIFRKDAEGRYVFVNSWFCRLKGLKAELFLGRTPQEVGRIQLAASDKFASQIKQLTVQGMDHHQQIMQTGRQIEVEEHGVDADGNEQHLHVVKSPIHDSEGKIVGSQGILFDINERRKAEEALQESQALYHSLVSQMPAGVFRKDVEGRYVFVNPWFCRLKGMTPEQFMGKTALELGLKNTALAANGASHHQQIMQTGRQIEAEEHGVDANGKEQHLYVVKSPIFDADGKIAGSQGILFDITERKQAEDQLRQMNAFLDSVIENVPHMLFLKEANTLQFVRFNRAGINLLGCSKDDLLGKTDHDFFEDKKLADLLAEKDRQVLRGKEVVDIPEESVHTRDRGDRILHTRKVPILNAKGEPEYLLGISEDITERKQAEESLRQSEANMAIAQSIAHFGSWELELANSENVNANPLRWSDEMFRIAGYEPGEVEVSNELFFRLVPAQEHKMIREAVATAIREHGQYFIVHRLIRPNGDTRIVQEVAQIFLDEKTGKPLKMIGTAHDITELKRAEQQLTEAFNFTQKIISDASVGIVVYRATGRCVLANETASRTLNATVPQLMEQDFRQIVSWRASGMLKVAEEALATKEPRHCEANFTSTFGKEASLVCHFSPFVQNGEPHLLLVFNDVTEKKKLEAQFLRAQRMESIGTLASGIAHDLNNVLSPLLFSIELLKENNNDNDRQKLLETLETNVHRGADLVKQVLAFGRGIKGERVVVQPRHIAREIEQIVRETFPKSVQFQLDIAPHLWTVIGDPTQIHQVLLNLSVNARDAMPDGGKLLLHLENTTLDQAYVSLNLEAKAGPYVVISVQDTGTGIPKEIRERIFEPFFTTKETGKGTGLGLSTSLAIVKSHGGFIDCYSQPGQGTTFRVYLPADATSDAAKSGSAEETKLPRGHNELVLVVDDEPSICKIAQKTLERFGYRVLLAANGAEAAALYASRQHEIAVVLTDMSMPVMDGPALIAALKSINPKVRIVGSSGLAEGAGSDGKTDKEVRHFIRKPYTTEAMLGVLHEILLDKSQPPV